MQPPSSDATMPPPPRPKPGPPDPSSNPPPPPPQRCPRCDSANTKFCYYNNYSLSQPRHFCKTCRRYWTKGGSLRNIPIGGASRKAKKRSSASSGSGDLQIPGSLRLFSGSFSSSATEYNHNGNINLSSPFGELGMNQFTSGGGTGLNFDNFGLMNGGGGGLVISSAGASTSGGGGDEVASSIESLSAHNLELHWKMQQQRMAMLYGGVGGGDNDSYEKQDQGTPVVTSFVGVGPVMTSPHVERPQPIFFHNLEVVTNHTKPQHQHDHHHHLLRSTSLAGNGEQAVATEWFFDSSYGGGGGNGNEKSDEKNKESSNVMNATGSGLNNGSGGGAQGWGEDQFHQFNGLV